MDQMNASVGAVLDTTTCPECGALAEVRERAVLESTDGPVEHARILCLSRHWFFLPAASLTSRHSTLTLTVWMPVAPSGAGGAS
ncbi:MAG: hypothetical protein JWP82_2867 [Humibacillus sp.]|nr:hypothetical protein [Humibacillus sp.]